METQPRRILQAGAIPVRDAKILLITSSSGKRWVIPKGRLEPGKSTAEIASQEAWEEAGVYGILHPRPLGSYLYEKWGDSYHVAVFLMEVTAVAEEWPECKLRQRRWFRPSKALARIRDPGLREILQNALESERVHGAPG